ncbi:trypco2 family protein [Streptomyces pseudovenezuelae]|uniref:trypco2 family protein n=1 Tax=Streptomyces pseudovenezuelae TaxID=67350 RepID=UPI0036E41118
MTGLGLADAVQALRQELLTAMRNDVDGVTFPIDGAEISVNVGITRAAEGSGAVKFWVIELGSKVNYSAAEMQTVTIKLGRPTDLDGNPISIAHDDSDMP